MSTPHKHHHAHHPTHNVSRSAVTASAGNIICYAPTMVTTNGVWNDVNPLSYSLPLLLLQILIVVITTRAVVFILKPLRQPRVISEIISGILLGPSVLGRLESISSTVFPTRSLLTLETIANLGLVFFLFLIGVEMDINVFRHTGRKAIIIALVGMAVPFAIGTSTSFVFREHISNNVHEGAFLLFLGVALSVTAFPVLARILAETKLLNSEIGRIAMSAAIVNDMCAWILLALSIALANAHETVLASLWVLLSGIAFVFICFYAVRPGMWWLIRHIPEGEGASDFQVCCILTGVMLASFVTDAIGIHSVFGAFIFGLVIPNGPLGVSLIEKLEDFVNGILLPLFFVISGLRTNIGTMNNPTTVSLLCLVFFLSSIGKIGGTVIIAAFYNMPFNEGITLGFLMSCKGLIEMIILNVGRDKQVLDDESFAVMVLTSLFMTSLITPVVTIASRPSRRLVGYKRRNLQRWSKPDSELRMMACLHNTRHVPTIISLLEISNPTKRSPIFVYALHLIELTGRASAMVVVNTDSTTSKTSRGQAPTEHILAAFENYEQHAGGVSVQTLTAVSPYATMHQDICSMAEDKHVSLIVLPFHKQLTVDGGMEATNPAIRTLNEKVFENAPCSVAILVDRGLSGATQIAAGQHLSHHIAIIFFGGPDDREALAYAWRMADHPGICLTVVRFLSTTAAAAPPPTPPAMDSRVITIVADRATRERMQDEEYLAEFRAKHMNDETVMYTVMEVSSSEETVTAIRTMDCVYDLYVVGRDQGEGSLTAGLSEFSECPELGPIGDLLSSSDFAATVSVLVVKQYVSPETESMGRLPAQQYGDPRERMVPARESVADPYQGLNGRY